MPNKKKMKRGSGVIVEAEVLPTIVIDCSDWIGDTPIEQWTRGPVLPVSDDVLRKTNGKRKTKRRPKR